MISQNEIQPVDKFIEKALYDKKIGYYSKFNPFGKKGDFVTAPLISPLFSEMIAVWVISSRTFSALFKIDSRSLKLMVLRASI